MDRRSSQQHGHVRPRCISHGVSSPQWPLSSAAIAAIFQKVLRTDADAIRAYWTTGDAPRCDRGRPRLSLPPAKCGGFCNNLTNEKRVELAARAARASIKDAKRHAAEARGSACSHASYSVVVPVPCELYLPLLPDKSSSADRQNGGDFAARCFVWSAAPCFPPSMPHVTTAKSDGNVAAIAFVLPNVSRSFFP